MSFEARTIKTDFSALVFLVVVASLAVSGWYVLQNLPVPVAYGVTKTWDGGGLTNNISDGLNWNDDLPPLAGDSLVFNGASVKSATWDALAPSSINSISVNDGYYSILDFGGQSVSVVNGFTVTNNGSSSGNVTTVKGGAGVIAVGGNLTMQTTSSGADGIIVFNAGSGGSVDVTGSILMRITGSSNASNRLAFDAQGTEISAGNIELVASASGTNGDVLFYGGSSGTITVTDRILLEIGSTNNGNVVAFNGDDKNITAGRIELTALSASTNGGLVFNAGLAGTLDVSGPVTLNIGPTNAGNLVVFNGGGKQMSMGTLTLSALSSGTLGVLRFFGGTGSTLTISGNVVMEMENTNSGNVISFENQDAVTNVMGDVILRVSGSASGDMFFSGGSGSLDVLGNLNITAGSTGLASLILFDIQSGDVSFGGNVNSAVSGAATQTDLNFRGGTGGFTVGGISTFSNNSGDIDGDVLFWPQSGTFSFGGNLTFSDTAGGGDFFYTTALETLVFNGVASQNVEVLENAIYNLTVANSGPLGNNTVFFDDNSFVRDVNGTLRLEDGVLDVKDSAGVYTIRVAGDWVNTDTGGSLNLKSGKVILDGGSQRVLGNTVFHDLEKITGATLTFGVFDTQTIESTGSINLQGSETVPMKLRVDVSGNQWRFDPQGTRTLCHLDVLWSKNINASAATCNGNCVGVDDPSTPANEGSATNAGWVWDPAGGTCPVAPPGGGGPPVAGPGNVHGFAWSENIGWMSFNSDFGDFGGGDSTAYAVNIDLPTDADPGLFSGYAWSDNIGWISFNQSDLAGCPTGTCEARLDWTTGDVTGWGRVLSCSGVAVGGVNEVEARLASDAHMNQNYGGSVAVAGDARTIIIGAEQDDPSAEGAAYILTRNADDTWTESFKLEPTGGLPEEFVGIGVDISDDGQMAVAGGNCELEPATCSPGAVYVFTYNGISWAQVDRLQPPNWSTDEQFGTSVAMSGDAQYILVSAPKDDSLISGDPTDDSGTNAGSVWVFKRDAGLDTYSQVAYLQSNTIIDGDEWGKYVDITDSGDRIIIDVQVFVKGAGDTWSYETTLTPAVLDAGDISGQFGVAIQGMTAVVGGPGEDSGNPADPLDNSASNAGAAWVWEYSGGVWSEVAYLKSVDGPLANDVFGVDVAINRAEDIIIAGADAETFGAGEAHIFRKSAGVWNPDQRVSPTLPGAGARQFGDAVAVNGDIIAVGDWWDDSAFTDNGAVYVYQSILIGSCEGWISLNQKPAIESGGIAYGVTVDVNASGIFDGEAWSDDFGWINFNNLNVDILDAEDYYVYLDGFNQCPFVQTSISDPSERGTFGYTGRYIARFRGREFVDGSPAQPSIEFYGHFTNNPDASIPYIPRGAYTVSVAGFAEDASSADQQWYTELTNGAYTVTSAPSADISGGANVWQVDMTNALTTGNQLVVNQDVDTVNARHENTVSAGPLRPICVSYDWTCPYTESDSASLADGRMVVKIRESLHAQGFGDTTSPFIELPQTLPAGKYDVNLATYEDHLGSGGDQPNEKVFITLNNTALTDIFTSSVTQDLAASDDFQWSPVDSNALLAEDAAYTKAYHADYNNPSPPDGGSIWAVCAAFDLQPPEIEFDTSDAPGYVSCTDPAPPSCIDEAVKGSLEGPEVVDWVITGPYDVCETRVGCPSNLGPDGDPFTEDDPDCVPSEPTSPSGEGQPAWLALDGTKPPAVQDNFKFDPIWYDHWFEMRCQNDSTVNGGWSPWTRVNVFRLTECNDSVDNDSDAFCDKPASEGGSCNVGTNLGDPGCFNETTGVWDDLLDDETHDPVCASGGGFVNDGICQSWWGETPLNCPLDCGIKRLQGL